MEKINEILTLPSYEIYNVLNLYSKDFYEYKFNWYPRIIVNNDIIVLPDSSKHETYNKTGVWKIILVIMAS